MLLAPHRAALPVTPHLGPPHTILSFVPAYTSAPYVET